MRLRIVQLRNAAVAALATACPGKDFSYIARQRGMFSYLGSTRRQCGSCASGITST